ncbi:MAG: acyl-CoA thioester hydrolase [Myxococcota bacterium]|jgi:acyl-CoA thioester hydrolase
MDALGHVNNAHFFRWFEESRIALFGAIGLQSTSAQGVGPILASTTCDFVLPVVWPNTIQVQAYIERIGNTSFTMRHLAHRLSDGALVAKGIGVVVLVDYDANKPSPIPKLMRDKLGDLMLSDAE